MTGAYATGIPSGGKRNRAVQRMNSYDWSPSDNGKPRKPTRHPGSKTPLRIRIAHRRRKNRAARRSRS